MPHLFSSTGDWEMKHINMIEDAEYNRKFERTCEMSQKLTAIAMLSCSDKEDGDKAKAKGCVHAMCLGLASIAGALQVASQIVTVGDEKATQDHMLFMAVLAALCNEPSKNGDAIQFGYTPGMILETLNFLERATGRKFDGVLLQPMVQAAREMEAAGDGPLKDFLGARAAGSRPQ
jgi:hypothetical protein